jgi:putative transposase
MPRSPRIDIPGLVYHVTNRGIRRLPLFHDDQDRFEFLDWMQEARRRYAIEVEQYSLMTNHFHLLLRLHEGSLARAMKYSMSRYARFFNRKNGHTGHLFQDRYHSLPVQEDRYYTAVSRYIHLNAPKAGIVSKPEDYRWSNYADLIDGRSNPVATGGTILDYFGRDPQTQRARYRQFVEEDLRKDELVSHETLLRMRAWGSIPRPPLLVAPSQQSPYVSPL